MNLLFLEDGAQSAESVTRWLVDLIRTARVSLDLAIYDCHPEGESADLFAGALLERQRAGVALRVIHNAPRPRDGGRAAIYTGHPDKTAAFFAAHGIAARSVGDGHGGLHLMHHKYLVVDASTEAARLWTGSANITTAAFTRQENNLLAIASPALAAAYAADFEDLWQTRDLSHSGSRPAWATIEYQGELCPVEARFSPGQGPLIDREVARRIQDARHDVTVAAFVISSGRILGALRDTSERGVPVSGIVDLSLMKTLFTHWRASPQSAWKTGVYEDLARSGRLHGKHSSRSFSTGPHDYMHNKVIVVDDTVITGSYNYSGDAQENAENILFIESRALAATYRAYIRRLTQRYPAITTLGGDVISPA